MRRIIGMFLVLCVLWGCAAAEPVDRGLLFRQKLLEGQGCRFQAVVTADYGETLQTFQLDCEADQQGNLTFSVVLPEVISGITGTVSEEGGALNFDDQVLAFSPLADGQIAPVTAPWILVHTLRGGYLRSSAQGERGLRLTIDDSYREDALQVDIWLDDVDRPIAAEILWDGRRILSMTVEKFELL